MKKTRDKHATEITRRVTNEKQLEQVDKRHENSTKNDTELIKKKTTEQKKNVVTSIKASSNSEVNKSDKSKMMILCDQHGRGLGKSIGKRVGGTTTVQTIIKPNARYDKVIDNIVNISQDFSLADNIVVKAGYNDFLRGKYPSFKNINDKLKHCTHTNITLVSVPYITEDYITNTNTFIYKFNIRLNDYVTRLNKYAEGKVTFLELNKVNGNILNLSQSTQNICELVNINRTKDFTKNLVFAKTTSLNITTQNQTKSNLMVPQEPVIRDSPSPTRQTNFLQ
ncbi:hypothetical protein JTB14_025005 [Gonioctena quinquepunctata]|nr:hypothetical protein JTB14_025005 [Gonioctena quinquepunctata]